MNFKINDNVFNDFPKLETERLLLYGVCKK